MQRAGTWFAVALLFLTLAPNAPGQDVKSDSDWSALYKKVKDDLWKGTTSKREKAVALIGAANWPGAVKTLVDFLKKPVPRLIPLENRKLKILQEIQKLMKHHDNQKRLSREDHNRIGFLQEDLKGINETLFRENRIKRLASRLLGRFTNEKAVNLILKEALSNRSWSVRLWLLESLAGLKDPRAVDTLKEAFSEEDPAIRARALESLAERAPDAGFEASLGALEDEFWQVRATAIRNLGIMGRIKAVEPLLEALDREGGRLKADAADALSQLTGKVLDADADLWKSWWANEENRKQAEKVCSVRLQLLSDEAKRRAEGVKAMAGLGFMLGYPVAVKALEDPEQVVREAALEAFEALRDLRAVPLLIDALEDEDDPLRRRIEQALIVLTGCKDDLDADPAYWKTWWRKNRDKVREGSPPPTSSPAEAGKAVKTGTSFYGIPTHSKKVMFVIDVSGSMNVPVDLPEGVKQLPANDSSQPGTGPRVATRMGLAQWELKKAVAGLPPEGLFNIAYYSSNVNLFSKKTMLEANDASKASAYKFVDELKAFGGTNIHDALLQAFSLADAKDESKNLKAGIDTIFFLSDGMPTLGEVLEPDRILEAVRERNRNRKIVIHVVCLVSKKSDADIPQEDPKKMEDFMRRLAEENGGRFVKR